MSPLSCKCIALKLTLNWSKGKIFGSLRLPPQTPSLPEPLARLGVEEAHLPEVGLRLHAKGLRLVDLERKEGRSEGLNKLYNQKIYA